MEVRTVSWPVMAVLLVPGYARPNTPRMMKAYHVVLDVSLWSGNLKDALYYVGSRL